MARAALVSVLLAFLFMGARCQDCVPVIDAANDAGLTTLVAAVQAAGLVDAIQANNLTIFAPTNDAFEDALDDLDMTLDELVADTELLTEILLYHVVGSSIRSGDIVNGSTVDTLLGNDSSCGVSTLEFNLTDGVGVVGGESSARVVTPDVETCTAVVHVIDDVLLPCDYDDRDDDAAAIVDGQAPANNCTPIVDAARDAGLTTLLTALEAAGLVDDVMSPKASLTVFAPTNGSFDAAVQALGITLNDLVANATILREILLYHVLPTAVRSADIQDGATAETLLGDDSSCGVSAVTFNLTEGVVVMGGETSATVVTPDVETCSAVVHVIDGVLLPCPVVV